MLTDEQIHWLVPVFKEAGNLRRNFLKLRSDTCYSETNESYFKETEWHEFFFDEDEGLYKITDQERGQYMLEVFGKTKKDIIRHIVNYYREEGAYIYANKQYIIDVHINSIEDCVFPPDMEDGPLKLIRQGKHISLFSKGSKHIVKVSFPDVHKYWRSSCFLGVTHEEEGCYYGVTYTIQGRAMATIDISRFFDSAEFLTLEVEILRADNKIDSQIIERLDIDKEDGTVSDNISII